MRVSLKKKKDCLKFLFYFDLLTLKSILKGVDFFVFLLCECCFCLQEMCEPGRCRVDKWLPLQNLLLPVILNSR